MTDQDSVFTKRWYVVGAPWLRSGLAPYVIAGHYDPHVGTPVVDCMDDDVESDADKFGIAQHICNLHNEWLDRTSTELRAHRSTEEPDNE